MANDIFYLVESKISTIEPISYSINFDPRPHRNCWIVVFSGDKQAILSNSDGKPISFQSEVDAVDFCKSKWIDLKKI